MSKQNKWNYHHMFCLAVQLSEPFLSSDQLLVAGSAALSKPPENKHTEGSSLCQQLECVCYGLGSFSSCVSARFQLAMLLLLLDAGQVG